MENSQLTTIVVTAVVSVIAKEVVIWLWATAKKFAVAETTRAKIKIAFNPENRAVLTDLLLIGFYSYLIISTGWTDKSVSGKDILIILGSTALLLVVVISLLFDLTKLAVKKKAD